MKSKTTESRSDTFSLLEPRTSRSPRSSAVRQTHLVSGLELYSRYWDIKSKAQTPLRVLCARTALRSPKTVTITSPNYHTDDFQPYLLSVWLIQKLSGVRTGGPRNEW